MRRLFRWLFKDEFARAMLVGREFERRILTDDAYWFSEDPVMMETLKRFVSGDTEGARRYWRENRKEQPHA